MEVGGAPERELKLEVDGSFVLPRLPVEDRTSRIFDSTYHDTSDLRLLRAGLTLRRRVENGKSTWQLKLPRNGHRVELAVPGGPATPPEIARLLPAVLRGSSLQPIASLRTRRDEHRVRTNGALAAVSLDAVSVLDRGRVTTTFQELEVELLDGDWDEVVRLADGFRKGGARPAEASTKLARAVRLAVPEDGTDGSARLQTLIRRQYHAILVHDPGVRLDANAEDVHQLRVATRRLRAILRAAREALVPEWAEPVRAELGWLADALGPVRDLDVLLDRLRTQSSTLDPAERVAFAPVLRRLEAKRAKQLAALVEVLASPRYFSLLDRLAEGAEEPPVHGRELSVAVLAADEFRRLRRAVRSLGERPTDEELHRARIRGKRARYAAELAEAAVGKPAARFVRRAKQFQDVLGEHQDAVVAEEQLRALGTRVRAPHSAIAIGRLVERERARREAARRGYSKAWARLDRAGRRAWL